MTPVEWIYLIVVVAAAAYAYTHQPEIEPPASVTELTVPTAEIGTEIPVLFGRRKIESSNVVYCGNLKITPIKSGSGKK